MRADLEQAVATAIAPFIGLRAEPRTEVWGLLRPRIDAAFAAATIPNDLADEHAVHAVRIQAKRLRYAYDLLAPALVDPRARKGLKHVQRAIGDARDRGLAARFVERHQHALREQGHMRLAAGLAPLVESLRAEALDAQTKLAPAVADFDRARIVATTQAMLGVRPLEVVTGDPPRAATER
jgi:hypothetical protein